MPDYPTGSSSTSSNSSADIFMNPVSNGGIDYLPSRPSPSEPALSFPKKNLGYFSPTVPSTVPGWRPYNPYQGTLPTPPSGFDPVGWSCGNCYFKLLKDGKNVCNQYKFEIPAGAWRCNKWVDAKAKFTPFVKEYVPFANQEVLQLVDSSGRALVDIYKLINVDPTMGYRFLTNYHSHTSTSKIPVFILGSFRYTSLGYYWFVQPSIRADWLPFAKYSGEGYGAVIPMSTEEKPGWIQYDIEPISNNFVNLRYLPDPNKSQEFLAIGGFEGFVGMMPRNIFDLFTNQGYNALPRSYSWDFSWFNYGFFLSAGGVKIIFSSGDDLVSGREGLEAYSEKSVPVTVNPEMFLADDLKPVPVVRSDIAVTPVSTGVLGIPREEKALNLFEDINKIGLDTSRWLATTRYQYSSVEPVGWFDSYGTRNNSDESLPTGALPYETALRVESDIQNSGINLFCRVPPSTFPWHRFSNFGIPAYDAAKAKWTEAVSFPAYGSPRINGVSSMAELTSRQYFAYQPGRITGFTFGVRACPPEFVGSNSEVTWGIENDENAIYFRLRNNTFSVCRSRFNFKNPFNYQWLPFRLENVPQNSFNGDQLNGFGPSGYTMKWDTVTMFKIEYGWYGGVGARLFIYVPVGNKSAKWVRIHDFGPPQSDSEPNTPPSLRGMRYPTLSTPWFKVFYRLISANGPVNDQGMLSLSKYGVSVYIDGGNPNSPQVTNVPGGIKDIPSFNRVEPTVGEYIAQNDVFPIISAKYKPQMRKRITADSIPGAKLFTTNYKVIVPKSLSVSASAPGATQDIPVRIDIWQGSGVKDNVATTGKVFTYPSGFNYRLENLVLSNANDKTYHFKKGNPFYWWDIIPPMNFTPTWSIPQNSSSHPLEANDNPTRPDQIPIAQRRYRLGWNGGGGVALRGGRAFGLSPQEDPVFYALRIADVSSVFPDPLENFRHPNNYTFNNAISEPTKFSLSGNTLDFTHTDMALISDPIFEPFFDFQCEFTGDVLIGLYYHKPSTSSSTVPASQIARSAGWLAMLESEITNGMWPLWFDRYSIRGPYGLFGNNAGEPGGTSYTDIVQWSDTKYTFDNVPSGLKYNTSGTRIVAGTVRGGPSQLFVNNQEAYGVHFVVLLSPGSSFRNLTISTNPASLDQEKRAVRFLGQPDSLYANSWTNAFLNKIYGKSLIGTGVEFPTFLPNETPYDYIRRLPTIYNDASFKWGRPGINVNVAGSSERLPLNFRDVDENSGILIDTGVSQKLEKSNFTLQGSFFVSANKDETSQFISSTLAGSGVSGFSDGPAASSVIGSQVGGSASDSQGNVYFADTNNHRIRKISTDGIVSTYAGTGTAGFLDGKANSDVVVPVATMANPELITMNNNGDIFFMEPNRHVVRRIDSFTGEVTDWATVASGLAIYGAMCRNYAGTEIFVFNSSTKKIYSMSSIDPSPTISEYTALVGSNYTLGGMSMDSLNRLYATSVNRHCVLQINLSNNTFSIIAGSTTGVAGSTDSTGNSARFNSPLGISSDNMGAVLYVADNANHTIRRISTQGTVNVTTFIGLAGNPGDVSGSNSSSRIRFPVGVTQTFDINATGFQLYFTEGNRVRYASQSTNAFLSSSSNSAGDAIGAVSTSLFSSPKNLIRQLDGTGDVYVADYGNNKIKAVTGFSGGSGLSVTTYAGNGTAGNVNGPRLDLPIAEFNSPKALAIDSNDNIYVTDSGSHVVRKITPGGIVSKILGIPNWGVDPFGAGAGATLVSPHGIAVDNNNQRLFVTLPTLNVVLGWTFADGTFVKIGDLGLISGSSTQSGSSDGDTSVSRLNNPQNLAVDSAGNVYVADLGNKFIRKISPPATTTAWTTTTLVLGSPNTSVFANPSGLAIDGQNYLYISDLDGDISKLNLTTGVGISIIAGQSGSSGFVDGNGSTTRFSSPAFLGWNSNKKALIVSDQLNFRIRQLIFEEATIRKKVTSFDLSNFFSYNGTAIRGPGDYTFFVTAKNMTSVEDGGTPVTVVASLQVEEG